MIKLFGGGSPHGDGPIEAANLTRLGLITENGLTSAGLELFIAALQAQRDARPRTGRSKAASEGEADLKGPWAGCAIDLTGGVGGETSDAEDFTRSESRPPAPERVESGLTIPS
jgi:hypothetical protein